MIAPHVALCIGLSAAPAEGLNAAPAEEAPSEVAAPAPSAETAPAPSAEVAAPAPSAETAPPAETVPPPEVQRPTTATRTASPPPAAAEPAVPDAAWAAVEGKRVAIDTPSGPVEGTLQSSTGDTAVLVADDGNVLTVDKTTATGLRVASPPAAAAPATAPPSTDDPSAAAPDEPKEDDKDDKKDKKKRREGKHAILGAFTAHGAAYAHWRGDGIKAGHAAYAMDWAIGANFTPGFGLYAMAGGLLGARIDNKTVKANAGHVAGMFAFGGKYYFTMFGAGVAFSRLKSDVETQKDTGLSLPAKIYAKIPITKHHLYIGIGISYELALVRNWDRAINGIGGQLIFGRW